MALMDLAALDIERLRRRLVAAARKIVATKSDAEDVAQEALLAMSHREPPPDDPAAFALGAARKLALKLIRDRANRQRLSVALPDPAVTPQNGGPPAVLAEAERWAQVDAAVEHVIVWGEFDDGGATRAVYRSLAELDVDAIQRRLAYYLAVIASLPRGYKQKKRLREQLQDLIRDAFACSSYEIRPRALPGYMSDVLEKQSKRARRRKPSAQQPPEENAATQRLIPPPLLSRGMALVRLICPTIEDEEEEEKKEAQRIAEEAMVLVGD
jgi:hypothetical protein